MSAVDKNYKKVIHEVRSFGSHRPNRTGIDTIAIPSAMFQHDMSEGFPILAGKKVSFHTSKIELIGFLLGITDKSWYQKNKCTIWDEWCNPMLALHGSDEERKKSMKNEKDLGPIYGFQWRAFNQKTFDKKEAAPFYSDQIDTLIQTLYRNPDSRRMIVSAWNPLELYRMALPPCHYAFQVLVINGEIHLNWNQRSVDLFLGLPYNICFYGLLLSMLAEQFNYKPGMLTGFLGDTHIYENHFDQVDEYLARPEPDDNHPTLVFPSEFIFTDEESMKKVKLTGYNPHPAIKAEVAI